jgi:cell division control protein 6
VNEQNEGPKGGSYYEYEFSIRPDLARETLREDTRLEELFDESEATTLETFQD